MLGETPGSISSETISISFNLSNKILLISSIIFFHFLPFLINRKFLENIIYGKKKNFLIALIFLVGNVIFFNYSINYTGGGVFFQTSNIVFNNNVFFYLVSFFSLLILIHFSDKDLSNLLIFFVLIISNIQNTIYHKYYDPLLLILFFTLLNTSLNSKFFKNKSNIIYVYGFYIVFILMRIAKNYFF